MNAEFSERIREQNLGAVEALEGAAKDLREKFVASAFEAVKVYLDLQLEAFERIEKTPAELRSPYEFYALETLTRVPFNDDKPQSALSLRLEPDENISLSPKADREDDGDETYMMVYVPVPDEVSAGPDMPREEVDAIPAPGFIAVELVVNGVGESWVIDASGVRPYVSSAEGEEITTAGTEGMASDDNEWEFMRLSTRVDSGMPVVSGLFERYTNWSAVVQQTTFDDEETRFN